MLQGIDSSTDSFLTNLTAIQNRLTKAENELSSGLRMTTASDDPDQVSELLQSRADLQQAQQVQSNLSTVKTETDTADQVLQNASQLMDQISTLGTQGANGTADANSRNTIAAQVGDILNQLVGIANTTVGGRRIFSGDSDQTQPYTIDLTQTNPVSAYAGTTSTRQVAGVSGSSFAVSRTAQDIFDSTTPGDNVFTAVNNLRQALLNNDQQGIQDAMTAVNSAATHLNSELSFYGTVQNQVSDATNAAQAQQLRLQTKISSIEDADTTQAIIDLQQAETEQQATLQTRAQIPRTSLFNFLG